MSLLLSEGHAYARQYPVSFVWSEARIVRQRNARKRALDAVLMQMVVSSLFSAEGGKQLNKMLERMDESD